MLLYSSPN